MVVAVLAGVVGLLTVVVAFYHRDAGLEPLPEPGPGWDPLPTPVDVARPAFPVALPGYDPASVDATVEALVVAYEELWSAAGPDARERARRAATRRRGLTPAPMAPEPDDVFVQALPAADQALPAADQAPVVPAAPGRDHVPEALRAAAALATLRRAAAR